MKGNGNDIKNSTKKREREKERIMANQAVNDP